MSQGGGWEVAKVSRDIFSNFFFLFLVYASFQRLLEPSICKNLGHRATSQNDTWGGGPKISKKKCTVTYHLYGS